MLGGILTALYRANLVVPAGIAGESAMAARETLAGASQVAANVDPSLAAALTDAAGTAFSAGVTVTALIGAGLVVIDGVIAAATLGRRQ